MAKVTLDFTPPIEPDVVALHVFEGDSPTGAFNEIERTTNIGVPPDYITRYTTQLAVLVNDWFTIAWENAAGDIGAMSQAVQGGTETLVGKVVDRVLLRDPSIDERVAQQEAEAAIQTVLGDNVDPYDTTLTLSYRQLNGLAYLTMARSYIVKSASGSGNVQSATIGLVSFRSGATAMSEKNIEALLDLANDSLGMSYSLVMLLEDIEVGNSIRGITWRDQSRLVLETEFP